MLKIFYLSTHCNGVSDGDRETQELKILVLVDRLK